MAGIGNSLRRLDVRVDGRKRFQTIDGFGVNINSKYWNGGKLAGALEMLADDLGATLFRQDAWGKSDWPDPAGKLGQAEALDRAHLGKVYAGQDFAGARGMGRWLNGRGIEPYLALSGIVPKWMCAPDGRTLRDFKSFGVMAASYAEWARKKAGIRFHLLGPLNETDVGPPEGPKAGPAEYVRACEALVDELDRRGLRDINLVVTEQANFNLDYAKAFARSKKAASRVGVFSMHRYGDGAMGSIVPLLKKTALRKARLWMTEFGDLDQSGEREWHVAWASFSRLVASLREGYEAAIFWDAFDNYHDHDESWTIYGLLRTGNNMFTPKRRYHAVRHVFRFVRPGSVRVEVEAGSPDIQVLAFAGQDGRDLTVTGMNQGHRGAFLNILVDGMKDLPAKAKADIYRTSEGENCARVATVPLSTREWNWHGIVVELPPAAIFTATTVR